MTIMLENQNLTFEGLLRIACHGEKVELHQDTLEWIKVCFQMLEEKIEAHTTIYRIKTGVGEFLKVVLSDEQVKELQKHQIYNPPVGIGYRLRAGQVTIANRTEASVWQLKWVLTADPGLGVIRHVNAGYPEAIEFTQEHRVKVSTQHK